MDHERAAVEEHGELSRTRTRARVGRRRRTARRRRARRRSSRGRRRSPPARRRRRAAARPKSSTASLVGLEHDRDQLEAVVELAGGVRHEEGLHRGEVAADVGVGRSLREVALRRLEQLDRFALLDGEPAELGLQLCLPGDERVAVGDGGVERGLRLGGMGTGGSRADPDDPSGVAREGRLARIRPRRGDPERRGDARRDGEVDDRNGLRRRVGVGRRVLRRGRPASCPSSAASHLEGWCRWSGGRRRASARRSSWSWSDRGASTWSSSTPPAAVPGRAPAPP